MKRLFVLTLSGGLMLFSSHAFAQTQEKSGEITIGTGTTTITAGEKVGQGTITLGADGSGEIHSGVITVTGGTTIEAKDGKTGSGTLVIQNGAQENSGEITISAAAPAKVKDGQGTIVISNSSALLMEKAPYLGVIT